MFKTVIFLNLCLCWSVGCIPLEFNPTKYNRIIHPDQAQYLGKKATTIEELDELRRTCGMVKPKPQTSSRVINGEEPNFRYPWTAAVIVHEMRWNVKSKRHKVYSGYRCMGSIVTNKITLTNGHCFCGYSQTSLQCLDNAMFVANLDHNIRDKNHVHVQLGDFLKGPWFGTGTGTGWNSDGAYDDDLAAYVYKYQPMRGDRQFEGMEMRFSYNGDAGVVVKKMQIIRFDDNIAPICLPYETGEMKENEPVMLVSWGKRDDSNVQACQTNEGRRKRGSCGNPISEFGRVFDPCRPKTKYSQNPTCQAVTINTFSESTTTVTFTNEKMNIHRTADDPCEAIWMKAREGFHKYYKRLARISGDKKVRTQTFNDAFDRIEVRDTSGHTINVCFNARRLGRYGICETHADGADNWGFCSRVCEVQEDLGEDEPYEELKLTYHDRHPQINIHRGSIYLQLNTEIRTPD